MLNDEVQWPTSASPSRVTSKYRRHKPFTAPCQMVFQDEVAQSEVSMK